VACWGALGGLAGPDLPYENHTRAPLAVTGAGLRREHGQNADTIGVPINAVAHPGGFPPTLHEIRTLGPGGAYSCGILPVGYSVERFDPVGARSASGTSTRGDRAQRAVAFHPQWRVAGKDIEITIIVQHGRMLPDRDGGDEAVDQFSHSRAPTTAHAVQLGRRLEVGQPTHGEAWKPEQSRPKLRTLRCARGPGQKLHDHRLGRGDRRVSLEMMTEGDVGRMPAATEQLNPGRRVGENHRREAR
jgi:hypothetical protein